ITDALTVVLLEVCVDVQVDGELDGLAGRARRRDHDHTSGRWLRLNKGLVIGDVVVVDATEHGSGRCKARAATGRPCVHRRRSAPLGESIAHSSDCSGGRLGNTTTGGFTSENPFTGGSFVVGFDFVESA